MRLKNLFLLLFILVFYQVFPQEKHVLIKRNVTKTEQEITDYLNCDSGKIPEQIAAKIINLNNNHKWSFGKTFPIKIAGAGGAVLQNKIYVVGGRNNNGQFLKSVYTYDILTNEWQQITPMHEARTQCAVVIFDNKLFVFGGYRDGILLNSVEVYDPKTKKWSYAEPMPTPRYNMIAQLVKNKIYVIGGIDLHSHRFNVNEVYDPIKNSWEEKSPMPTALRGMAAASYNRKIYIFGGFSSAGDTDFKYVYDTKDDQWTTLDTNFTPRTYLSGIRVRENIYLCGGYQDSTLKLCEIYNLETNKIYKMAPFNIARRFFPLVYYLGKLYAIGGSLSFPNEKFTNTVEVYPLYNTKNSQKNDILSSKLFLLKKSDNIITIKKYYHNNRELLNNLRWSMENLQLNIYSYNKDIKNLKNMLAKNKKYGVEKKIIKTKIKKLKKAIKQAKKRIKYIKEKIPKIENDLNTEKKLLYSYLAALLTSLNNEITLNITVENEMRFDENIPIAKIKSELMEENEKFAKSKAKQKIIKDYLLNKIDKNDIIVLNLQKIGEGKFKYNLKENSEIDSISFTQNYEIKCKIEKNPFE